MKVVNVECEYLVVSVPIPVRNSPTEKGILLVTVETDTGVRGFGLARQQEFHALAARQVVLCDIAPYLMGQLDDIVPGHVWHEGAIDLAGSLGGFGGGTGVAARAMSAVDQALWDIWGQAIGQPVYQLLGGSQPEIELYATFGMNIYTPEEEAEAARQVVQQGFTTLKLQGADERNLDIEVDAARVKRLREAVGDKARIILDCRNIYSLYQAIALAKLVEPYNLAYLDEPLYAKDPLAQSQLRKACPGVPLAARSRGGTIWDNRELIASGSIDALGTNVLDQGGFTQSIKVAHMAEMYQLPIVTGGGWHLHNAHLIAAVSNGWMTEYHAISAAVLEEIFDDPIKPNGGRLRLSEKPGLGLSLNDAAVKEARERARVAERAFN